MSLFKGSLMIVLVSKMDLEDDEVIGTLSSLVLELRLSVISLFFL